MENNENFIKGLVSVIIPTYCAEKHIARCLKSIKNQTYKKVEIIVVDQSSPDQTKNIARRYTEKILSREKPKFYSPPSFSRNLGERKAQGEFLLNIDSDMELEPNLIEYCVKNIRTENCVGLIIHERDIALNFWSRCRALEKKCMINDPYMEAARFSLRKTFREIEGYDSSLGSGEDWDLQARLKERGKVGYSQGYILHHTGKKHILKNFVKMINYGKTFDKYIRKHPELAKKQLTPFREMYFKNWELLARNPLLTGGLVLLKFTEFFGAFVGLVLSRDEKKADTDNLSGENKSINTTRMINHNDI